MDDISVVIVNYKTSDLTIRCVNSIISQAVAPADRIIVVDNKSPNDDAEKIANALPSINLIRNNENRGYAAGVNIGMRNVQTRYAIILNPDTYFLENAVSKCIALLESDPTVGVVGLDLRYPNGERQYSARRFYSLLDIVGRRIHPRIQKVLSSRIDTHMMRNSWAKEAFDADWVMGTGFVVSSKLFASLGGMDERYFLYFEDVDLCARVWLAGYRVCCMPNVVLIHDHQRSSKNSIFSRHARWHIGSFIKYSSRFGIKIM